LARNTFATINVGAIRHNLARVRAWAPTARVMAVVKADAYGHGLARCLPALADADLLAVATMDEARAIRELLREVPILLLEGIVAPSELPEVERLGLELVVHHECQLEWLDAFGRCPEARVWLKLDSGMHRLGIPPNRVESVHRRLAAIPGVQDVVLMTHFASADQPGSDLTRRQLERFERMTQGFSGARCLANSAAIVNFPTTHCDWVRAGLLLYGASPVGDRDAPELGLEPAMTLESRLIAVNSVAAGEAIGYGARFVAPHALRIGVAAIGYGDGYPRNMPDGTPVLVNGMAQPLAGRVSMDMITIDITAQPDARVGDPVVLWGQGLPVERIARAVDTIPYELLCRVTRRVKYRSRGESGNY